MDLNVIFQMKKTRIKLLSDLIKNSEEPQEPLSLEATSLNDILGGGFRRGNVYVFFGENKTGKTQLAHQICTQGFDYFSKRTNKILGKSTLYFDTEGTFRPERIKELSQLKGLPHTRVLKSIIVSRNLSNSALLMALKKAEKQIRKHSMNILIVDSINNHFRSERGRDEGSFLALKRDFLKILRIISELTTEYHLITLITAQVTPNFIRDSPLRELPVGLQYLNHFFTEIIYLYRKDTKRCYAHLVNSLSLPEKRLVYTLSSRGLRDYKV